MGIKREAGVPTKDVNKSPLVCRGASTGRIPASCAMVFKTSPSVFVLLWQSLAQFRLYFKSSIDVGRY